MRLRPAAGPRPVLGNRTVWGIGLSSLLSDSGHEMVTAALPGFLRSLGAPAAALGAIEGVADAALSASKLAGGAVADRPGVSRRWVAAGGNAVKGLANASLALASSWPLVALARAAAWAARGGRTPARDALIAGAVPPEHLGRAFGVERAADSVGAIAGPLAAAALIGAVGYRWLFAASLLPALAAGAAILVLAEERGPARDGVHAALTSLRGLLRAPGPFRSLLLGVGLYGLGNFSATLLILRATDLLARGGRSPVAAASLAVLLYTGHNAANAVAAYPAGALADRVGRRVVLAAGVGLFAAACFAFALGSGSPAVLAGLFAAVGASTGMVETAQGSHASELLPPHLRGRGFGVLGLVDGVGDLVSSVVVGALWTVAPPAWGFLYAGLLSLAGAGVLLSGLPGRLTPAGTGPAPPGPSRPTR